MGVEVMIGDEGFYAAAQVKMHFVLSGEGVDI